MDKLGRVWLIGAAILPLSGFRLEAIASLLKQEAIALFAKQIHSRACCPFFVVLDSFGQEQSYGSSSPAPSAV